MTPHPRSRIRACKQLRDLPWEELPLEKCLTGMKCCLPNRPADGARHAAGAAAGAAAAGGFWSNSCNRSTTARLMVARRNLKFRVPQIRKSVMSIKLFARNSGARNGCANFMGAWKRCVLSARKTHVHKIPPFRGGGECRFYFYGREDFSEQKRRSAKGVRSLVFLFAGPFRSLFGHFF